MEAANTAFVPGVVGEADGEPRSWCRHCLLYAASMDLDARALELRALATLAEPDSIAMVMPDSREARAGEMRRLAESAKYTAREYRRMAEDARKTRVTVVRDAADATD